MKRNDTDVSFMPTLCEVHGDDFDDDWSCKDETPADVANAIVTV